MKQRLEATYLRPGLVERTTAIGIGAVCIGTGILLAAWGISFLWRYTPPEIAVRVANPEPRRRDSPLKVSQDKPFVVVQSEPLKIDPAKVIVKVDEPPRSIDKGVSTDSKTAAGDVIDGESPLLQHQMDGTVVASECVGGSGGVPIQQFCYYTAPNVDHSSNRVDIASNEVQVTQPGRRAGPRSRRGPHKVPMVARIKKA